MTVVIDFFIAASFGALLGQLAPQAPVAVVFAAFGLATVSWRRLTAPALILALLLFGVGSFRAQHTLLAYELSRSTARDALGAPETCAGTVRVESSPVRRGQRYSFIAESIELTCEGTARVSSGTRLRLYAQNDDLARGDVVAAVVRMGTIEIARNFEIEGGLAQVARSGATLSGGVLDGERVFRDHARVGSWIDRARAHVRKRIEVSYPTDAAPMARALVLGENDLPQDDTEAFQTSGLSHVLAVSGTHVVIAVLGFVGALHAVLKRIENLGARMDVGRIAAATGIPAAWIYAEFAGSGGSVRRAACMATVALLARVLGRHPNGPRAFGLSLLAGALADSLAAYDVSFGLSAGATAGLILASNPIQRRLDALPRPLCWVSIPVAATVSASAFCLPWLTLLSPKFSIVGVLANILAVPIGEMVSLPACLAHVLLAPVPPAERGVALLASGGLLVVRAIARQGAALDALAFDTPRPTEWQLAIASITVAALVCHPQRRRECLAVGTCAWILLESIAIEVEQPRDVLRVTVLDVGQGDSILVDFPNRQAMLIDGGGVVGSPVDPGSRVIAPVLRARRRTHLSVVALSHPHPDHFLGFASVLPTVQIGQFWDTGQGEADGAGPAYRNIIAHLRSRKVPIRRPGELCGRTWTFGEAKLRVLGPCPTVNRDRNANSNSYVFHVRLGQRAALLVGDAEREQETELLNLDSSLLRADLLKVGHHGSRSSSSDAFLDAVRPSHAIITSGVRNRYGHPAPQTLDALQRRGITVFRSDRHGAVSWETDGHGVSVHSVLGTNRK